LLLQDNGEDRFSHKKTPKIFITKQPTTVSDNDLYKIASQINKQTRSHAERAASVPNIDVGRMMSLANISSGQKE